MNRIVLFALSLLILSCQTSKQLTEVDDGIPAWVKEFPVSESHYTGIGIADRSSHPQDYIQIAQQNALQNLISQIKVTISSQSVFLQMDREYAYEEDFKSNIEVKASEILEGYELVGTFNQNNEYWVYYRLNKLKYQESRSARINEAIEESKYFLNKAIKYSTPLEDKYIYYVQALDVLEPFLSEPLKTEFDRETVYLGSEIIARFRAYVDDYQIYCLSKKLKAMIGNSINTIKLAVEHEGKRLVNIPLITTSKLLELKDISHKTDSTGVFITSVPKIKSTENVQKIEVGIDFQPWLDVATSSAFIKKLFKNVKTHQIDIPVYVYTPTVYVSSEEKHFGTKEEGANTIRFAAESALTQLGFTPVANKSDAQIFLNFSSDTRKGREEKGQKMFTAFLNMKVQAKDLEDRIIFNSNLNKLKGIQLDFVQADSEAYQQAVKAVKKTIIPEFVNSFVKE